jgi:cell division transport system ATP-binding protein
VKVRQVISGDATKILFNDVSVDYSATQSGLRKFSLSVFRGEFLFLVGRTGAGNSTVLNLLTREVKETRGEVFLFGKNLSQCSDKEIPSIRRTMGIVPQDYALLPKKTVWENVAYAMRAAGHSRRAVRRRVPEILDQVSVGHRADGFPSQLSGGEQQRVAIARALINEPSLLIADEPTGNLDPEHSWEIMETLKRLNQSGTTVLVASHDMMVIHRLGKRVVTLELGQIVSDVPGGGDV